MLGSRVTHHAIFGLLVLTSTNPAAESPDKVTILSQAIVAQGLVSTMFQRPLPVSTGGFILTL